MRPPWALWTAALAALFLYRLAIGFALPFFGEDETQIFLIGLRAYAAGTWPYFGPDVVWTRSVIPGALQAMLVAVPLKVWPIPEAPYVFLNLLSMAALSALCWYISRRLPSIPRWLVWGWVMTLPWTLRYSTHIVNPSYVLPASVVFFIGFFESIPVLRRGLIPIPVALAMMGGAMVWIAQVHMSYALLPPYALVGLIASSRRGGLVRHAAAFGAGAIIPGLLLVPTWLRFGASMDVGGTLRNLHLHPISPWVAITVLARVCSFASLEVHRFIATDDPKRLVFVERHLWLAAAGLPVYVAGLVQPVWMVREWFRTAPYPEWRAIKALMAGTVVWIYASEWFVMEPSQAHAFYVVAPLAIVYAAYAWTLVDGPRLRYVAAVLLALNVIFQGGLALAQADQSLYHDRAVAAAAVRLKQPEMLAHRRAFAFDGGPVALHDPARPYDPVRDLQVIDATCASRSDGVLMWTLSVYNTNPRVAFRDVMFVTTYPDADRERGDRRHEFVRQVFQPGQSRQLEINDGFAAGASCRGASLRVAAADALLPVDRSMSPRAPVFASSRGVDSRSPDDAEPASCGAIATFADGKTPNRVVHVSTVGNDAAGDGSKQKPYGSIARAARALQPGTAIHVHAGTYPGGIFLTGARGTASAPIWIMGAPDEPRPVLEGGGEGLHLTRPRYVVIQHLEIRGSADNGINIDDGGDVVDAEAARFVILRDVGIHDAGTHPSGVADCFKLAGVSDVFVLNSAFERCGSGPGSGAVGVGGVGVHRAVVSFNRFTSNGYGGVQFKGGSDDVQISSNTFHETGWRAVNMGGRTDESAFRPPLSRSRPNYEAARIRVQANAFVGSEAAASFTGCVDCEFSYNTVIDPARWVLRILQESVSTPTSAFAPASNGRIAGNIFYFRRSDLNTGEDINVGRDTDSSSFELARNLWYAHDAPRQSAPRLAGFGGTQMRSIAGSPPDFVDVGAGDWRLKRGSVAAGAGDPAFAPRADVAGRCVPDPPNLGAAQ